MGVTLNYIPNSSDPGPVTSSYWNTETTGQSTSAGSPDSAGKTTSQLQAPTRNTGIYAGWSAAWWDFGTSRQYPALKYSGLSVALQRGQAQPSPQTGTNNADRAALVAFYNAAGGATWTNNANWNTNAPLGEWHGVVTDGDGRVTELRLPSNGLSGQLPAELGSLAQLSHLDLDNNGLSGAMPLALGNLSNLTILRLGSNQLSGSIPAQLGNLSKLEILGLGNNQLTGSIPPQLGNLTSLTRFSAWNNQLTGTIPGELGNLTGLTRLVLGNNRLSGAIPVELGRLSSLAGLFLQYNQLTGGVPSTLASLSNLTDLRLHNNSLSGAIPSELGGLDNLQMLNLSSNDLSGPIPSELGDLANLTRLYLYDNQLTGKMPAELGRLSNLEVLNLSDNQLSGTLQEWLSDSASVARLDSDEKQLNVVMLPTAGHPLNLEVQYLYANPRLSRATPATSGAFPNLRVLDLSDTQLTGVVPSDLGNLTSLRRLYLHGTQLTGTIPPALGGLEVASLWCLWWCDDSSDPSNDEEEDPCAENEGAKNDRNALDKLFELTDGRNVVSGFPIIGQSKIQWTNYTGWDMPDKPLGERFGVTVQNCRVTHLLLPNNNLSGRTSISDWATHLTNLNKGASGAGDTYPLYWMRELDLSDNRLDGDIGAVLSALRLRPGATLTVDLSGDGNKWTNEYLCYDDAFDVFVCKSYKDLTTVTMNDSGIADKTEEKWGVDDIPVSKVAATGLKVLRYGAQSRAGVMIGKIGGRVSVVGAVLEHETITTAFIRLMTGTGLEDVRREFFTSWGFSEENAEKRAKGCVLGQTVVSYNGQRCCANTLCTKNGIYDAGQAPACPANPCK